MIVGEMSTLQHWVSMTYDQVKATPWKQAQNLNNGSRRGEHNKTNKWLFDSDNSWFSLNAALVTSCESLQDILREHPRNNELPLNLIVYD